MDLIERYLHAVKGHLPLKQQDDVIAELAEDLRSRLDDREAELGRPLDEDEVVAILKQLGHPAHLAARYGSWQQLIGPALFPMYVHILKFALGLALLVNVVLAAVLLATGRPPGEALRGIVNFPFVTAIMVFGWVTIVFALIDAKVGPAALADVQSGHKALFDKWDPRTLPPVPRHPVHGACLAARASIWSAPCSCWPGGSRCRRTRSCCLVRARPSSHRVPACLPPTSRSPSLVRLSWSCASSRCGSRTGARVLGLISNAVGLAAIGALLQTGGPYVVAAAGADAPADLARAMGWINRAVVIGMAVVAVITLADMFKHVWRLGRARRPGPGAASASTPPGSPR